MKCYLYIISDGFSPHETRYVKIGITSNPIARIKNLQTANPNQLFFDRLYEYENQYEAEAIERIYHRKLKKINSSGEWFKYSNDLELKLDVYETLAGPCVLKESNINLKEFCNYKTEFNLDDKHENNDK